MKLCCVGFALFFAFLLTACGGGGGGGTALIGSEDNSATQVQKIRNGVAAVSANFVVSGASN